jgi:cation diffusion facilitator CzcD-associated flavoprotein CzcO
MAVARGVDARADLRSANPNGGQITDVAVIGAGPYGLSTAASLVQAGLNVRVFGKVMSFWEEMPEGMLLRSPWAASHFGCPAPGFDLDSYEDEIGARLGVPIPLERFIGYGKWFAQKALPEIDERRVTSVAQNDRGYVLRLDDDEEVAATAVVLALGIDRYAYWPSQFEGFPKELVTHSSEHMSAEALAGKHVGMVGAGQSAVEFAALLHENGADVELLVRAPGIRWLSRSKHLHSLGPISRVLYAPTDVGPVGVSRVVAAPNHFRRLPQAVQADFARRSTRPAAAAWLVSRTKEVRVTTGVSVTRAHANGKVEVELSDGSRRAYDHLVLGTGYRVDVRKHPLLAPSLAERIRLHEGYPVLNNRFETSLPNLYVVGAPAAHSFGPLMRFVAGTEFTSRALAPRLAAALRGHNNGR